MSTKGQRSDQTYTEQLSDFESQLRYTMDDQALQQDVFRAVRALLNENKRSEADIRRILLDRFEAGQLREETLQVVQKMLDQVASEFVDTMPDDDAGADDAPDFARTDVLPRNVLESDSPVDQLQPGSILRDRFLLQQRIAGGSMGVVYRALDRRMAEVDGVEPWVAIKLLAPKLARNATALRAIQQEAAKGRCLSHPNIVRYLDFDREDGTYFLVMEWIEGRSLAAILDDPASKPFDTAQVIDIVRQLASALEYAHRCGVVHADVKPGNVMLCAGGNVKLIDFGVARIRQTETDSAPPFDPKVLGAATPAYSSMQVLTGEDPVPADDVFSLACLMYRLVAGYRVFGPRNAAEAAEEGMVPQRPQGIDDHQWRTLKKALSFARVARFSSPKAFVDELLQGQAEAGASSLDEETAVNAIVESPSRRLSIWLPAAAVTAALALGAAWQAGLLAGLAPDAGDGGPDSVLRDSSEKSAAATSPDENSPPLTGTEAAVVEPRDTSDDAPADVSDTTTSAPDAEVSRDTELAADGEILAAPADADVVTGSEAGTAADAAIGALAGLNAGAPVVGDSAATANSIRRPPTHELSLGRLDGSSSGALDVVLREDGTDAVIDLVRGDGLSSALTVAIDEVSYSGNRSPLSAGQYLIENDGIVNFAPGQSIAQLGIAAAADPVREADIRAQLVLREAYLGDQLGVIELTVEDDDQRAYESRLPVNTVAFAVSQVSVAESEAAVQIDLVRFRPGPSELTVTVDVFDVTATQDVDYFVPSDKTVVFAAGQRAARILIPLVQDAEVEADEAFVIELSGAESETDTDIFRRVAVMIRDDDG